MLGCTTSLAVKRSEFLANLQTQSSGTVDFGKKPDVSYISQIDMVNRANPLLMKRGSVSLAEIFL